MDDGLAEKLFDSFWSTLVAAGWPLPWAWASLHRLQREAWEHVAIAARQDAATKQDAEIAMLRGANAALQRENSALRAESCPNCNGTT